MMVKGNFKKSMLLGCFLFFIGLCLGLEAHEGHHHSSYFSSADFFLSQNDMADAWVNWLPSVGRLHLVFLHFPIALIIMTVVAELLAIWFINPLFTQAARFMIYAAAFFAPITALLGLAFSYGQYYEGISLDLFVWHRYFGLLTAGLAIVTAILRERYARQLSSSLTGYYIFLFFLFFSVSLAGTFGGSLTFGI